MLCECFVKPSHNFVYCRLFLEHKCNTWESTVTAFYFVLCCEPKLLPSNMQFSSPSSFQCVLITSVSSPHSTMSACQCCDGQLRAVLLACTVENPMAGCLISLGSIGLSLSHWACPTSPGLDCIYDWLPWHHSSAGRRSEMVTEASGTVMVRSQERLYTQTWPCVRKHINLQHIFAYSHHYIVAVIVAKYAK